MVLWRNFIILFGGFYEAMREVRWYNDLYFFSLVERKWVNVPFRSTSAMPKPRSGHQMFLHAADDILYIYGGYAKEKSPGAKQEGLTHEDMWSLNLKPLVAAKGTSGAASTTTMEWNKLSWQRVARKGESPTPRCGAVISVYRNKALLFGGVYDMEGSRHSMLSTFYSDLYAFDMDRKRWYKLGLKQQKAKLTAEEKKAQAKAKAAARLNAAQVAAAKGAPKRARTEDDGSDDGEDGDSGDEGQQEEAVPLEESEDEEEDEEEGDDEIIIDALSGGRVSATALKGKGELFGYIDDNGDVVYLHVDDMEDEEGEEEEVGGEGLKDAAIAATPASASAPAAIGLEDITTSLEETHLPSASTTAGASTTSAIPTAITGTKTSSSAPPTTTVPTSVPVRTLPTLRNAEDFARFFSTPVEPCPRINPCTMIRYEQNHNCSVKP